MHDTHDAVACTSADDNIRFKRLKVPPQLSLELWREILRHRSMQIEVLRVEKLNRHREFGYQAVLEEFDRLSFECYTCFHALDRHDHMYFTPWWIKVIYDNYKARNPRKRTKKGILYKKWEKHLPHRRCTNVRLLYVCADELRAGTFSNHL
jgi:hypothetical protein